MKTIEEKRDEETIRDKKRQKINKNTTHWQKDFEREERKIKIKINTQRERKKKKENRRNPRHIYPP